MREFRKKQKALKRIMHALVIIGVVFILVYIGVQPTVAELSSKAALICSYICDFLVIANMVVVFIYYTKYGKTDAFLERTEHEISDCGYYFTKSSKKTVSDFISEAESSFKYDGFAVQSNVEIDDLDFAFTAFKSKEFYYFADVEDLNRDDVTAYTDVVINDIAVHNLKRSGNGVICFVTDKAQEGAIALSKMITPLGKKEQIKIAIAIVEPETSKCFFLGNMQTKCQQMIANYILKTPVPIPDELKGKERLSFQSELEEKMKDFSAKEFLNGTFYVH